MLKTEKKGGKMAGDQTTELPEHLSLWQDHLDINKFAEWCGKTQTPMKMATRSHVISKGYKSVFDAGAGLCSQYYGFLEDGYSIDYTACEITPKYVEFAKSKGINCVLASADNLPFEDERFEVSLCIDVMNHLKDYRHTIDELIRVTSKEILINFFKPFEENAQKCVADSRFNVYETDLGLIQERFKNEQKTTAIYSYFNFKKLEDFLKSKNISSKFLNFDHSHQKLLVLSKL